MATHKVKRSIHLTQPQPTDLMPVRAHAYRSLAEMNNGLEQAIQGLETLRRINYLSSESLHGIHYLLSRLRAQANRELMAVLAEREAANARHFQQLCLESKGTSR